LRVIIEDHECPLDFRCMNAVTVAEVVAAASRMLARQAWNEEMQRDLGEMPKTKPMDKNMKMDHMNM